MSAEKQIPPGYKMTEVGVIPEEWEYQIVDRITTVVASGHSHVNSEFGDYPVYGSTGIIGRSTFSDYSGKAVLIARVGANAGKIAVVDGHYCVTDNTIIVKSANSICMDFFWRQLEAKRLNSLVFGSGQPLITGTQVKKLYIPIPPTLAEQEAIAAALSDADGLIEALEALIAKKRAIKQGAMQELLTGKRRLPGFEGKWEEKTLAKVADIRSGGTPSTSQAHFWDGEILWCTPTDITALNGFKYLDKTARTITQIGLISSSAELIPRYSIIMTSRATIGECAINIVPVTTNQGFKNFVPFEDFDHEFLYYLLQIQKKGFLSLCGGSTFLEIGKIQLSSFVIKIPVCKKEQSAIATVLSDMDAEIEALEDKLAKARRVKVGMMQELLTGRIRLV